MRSQRFHNVFLSFVSRIVHLVCVVVVCFGFLLQAQDVHIRVLNGRNGRPIKNECLNVWTGLSHGAHMVAGTNQDGIATLHVAEGVIEATIACPGWPTKASGKLNIDGITVSADHYIACQENGKPIPGTSSEPRDDAVLLPQEHPPIRGEFIQRMWKISEKAEPGEFIFFVRPRNFWKA